MSGPGQPIPPRSPAAGRDPFQAVFDAIRLGTAQTRREIAEHTGLSPSVVARCVRRMLAKGLIEDVERAHSTGGRAARMLKIRGRNGWVFAVDLGMSHISAAMANLGGAILAARSRGIAGRAPRDDVLKAIDDLFAELSAEHAADGSALAGIGIGLPGARSGDGQSVVATALHPGWVGYPLGARMRKRYGVPAFVENDAKVMALGELRAGSLKDSKVGLFVKVGTGIGAGVTINGTVHRGVDGWAGDIGHVWLGVDTSTRCRCGNVGCLEAVAGGAAIARAATAAASRGDSAMLSELLSAHGELTTEDVRVCAHHGDPASLAIVQRASDTIGAVLSMAVNVLNPDVVTISGGVARTGDAFLSGIRKQVYGHSHPGATRHLRIEPSELGERGGVTGAAWLILDALAAGRIPGLPSAPSVPGPPDGTRRKERPA
jgi:predicted NBD/HSP70 family sugar kinase